MSHYPRYYSWTGEDAAKRPLATGHVGGKGRCGMGGPAGSYVCTRPAGHHGTHEAGVHKNGDTWEVVAVWTQL